jgi:hypothetical protein
MAQNRQHRVALSFRRFTEIHVGDISIITKLLVSCALAALTFAAAPQALKAADNEALCPLLNATLHGTYMVTGGGTVVGVGPVAAVGTITYDGKGGSVNTFTASGNGMISKGVTVTGPYTVNADCTGSLTQSDGSHYDFVVNPDGSTVFWIETDDGTVISGTEVRFRHSSELKESRYRNAVKVPLGGAATERVNIRKRTVPPPRSRS